MIELTTLKRLYEQRLLKDTTCCDGIVLSYYQVIKQIKLCKNQEKKGTLKTSLSYQWDFV